MATSQAQAVTESSALQPGLLVGLLGLCVGHDRATWRQAEFLGRDADRLPVREQYQQQSPVRAGSWYQVDQRVGVRGAQGRPGSSPRARRAQPPDELVDLAQRGKHPPSQVTGQLTDWR